MPTLFGFLLMKINFTLIEIMAIASVGLLDKLFATSAISSL